MKATNNRKKVGMCDSAQRNPYWPCIEKSSQVWSRWWTTPGELIGSPLHPGLPCSVWMLKTPGDRGRQRFNWGSRKQYSFPEEPRKWGGGLERKIKEVKSPGPQLVTSDQGLWLKTSEPWPLCFLFRDRKESKNFIHADFMTNGSILAMWLGN